MAIRGWEANRFDRQVYMFEDEVMVVTGEDLAAQHHREGAVDGFDVNYTTGCFKTDKVIAGILGQRASFP